MTHPLIFQWGVSTLFGWGVYGLNLLRHWPKVAGTPAFCGSEIDLKSLEGMDALRRQTILPLLSASQQVRAHFAREAQKTAYFNGIVLHSMGNAFAGSATNPAAVLSGQANFGVIFFEDTNLPNAVETSGRFHAIVAGSRWCEHILRERGARNVATVLQGVDASLFHPAPRWGALDGRFAVFSGGKLEHRKGQDLVVVAFRAFAARHPEAVLVTAWHSPWPQSALSLNRNGSIAPIALGNSGQLDIPAWAQASGIAPHQFIDLGAVPNHAMPQILREMDVALFPNRCEGGTNLVAMECMACGIPVILSDNTGHKDLTATGAPYALTRQEPVVLPNVGTDGWGESDVEEIVEALERVFRNREEASRRGRAGANVMSGWSWERQIGHLHATLDSYCAGTQVA